MRLVAAAAATAGVLTSAAGAAHPNLLRAVRVQLVAAERADRTGASTAATAQAQYDAARELEEALPPARYLPSACLPLYRAVRGYARGLILEAEGFDRPKAAVARAGDRRAHASLLRVRALGRTCDGSDPRGGAEPYVSDLGEPRHDMAFFGRVVQPASCGRVGRLFVDGRAAGSVPAPPPNYNYVFTLKRRPASYDLEVRQDRAGRPCWRSFARSVFLLPSSARKARAPATTDRALAARLAAVGRSFGGYSAFYVHDLSSGRAAGWNADARFPAASTVKLGLLVAVMRQRRFFPYARTGVAYDLRAMTTWSSNLATNRLLRKLGDGSETLGGRRIEATLRALGATRSTFPGGYRVGTARTADAPNEPPLVSSRVTTARDLGRVLWWIHAAAAGGRRAQRTTGLDGSLARLALGLLLDSEARENNVGLRPLVPRDVPVAQKNGWTSTTRHTAALVYGTRGPTIIVALGYRSRLGRGEALRLWRRVVAAARL